MGFPFRRSSSFGPLRLNFSKSGIGASVGVKGARITLSPKGTTYITVGYGGFSYRKTLSSGSEHPAPSQFQTVKTQPTVDEIEMADVEQLLESSKSDFVQPMCIDLGKLRMYFLPDQIIYWQHGTFASIEYSDLRLGCRFHPVY